MGNPFTDLIAANPTAATLHIPPAVGAYAPSDAANLTPRTPTSSPTVTGLFVKATAEDLAAGYVATLTLALADLPAARPEELKVTVLGVAYNAATVRPRFWRGAQVAWTLGLTA